MSILIKTYSNPYCLKKEKFWGYIKDAFQLCVSQTLVNGMCDNYSKHFYAGKLTTISSFVNNYLFKDWYDEGTIVKQYAEIDNLILNSSFNGMINDDTDGQKIRDSLRLNRQQIFNSIRVMFELDMNPDEMNFKRVDDTHTNRFGSFIYAGEIASQLSNQFEDLAALKLDKASKTVAHPARLNGRLKDISDFVNRQ